MGNKWEYLWYEKVEGWVCQLQRNLFCMGIRENSTVRLGASTIIYGCRSPNFYRLIGCKRRSLQVYTIASRAICIYLLCNVDKL
jgi:hypothetical protein